MLLFSVGVSVKRATAGRPAPLGSEIVARAGTMYKKVSAVCSCPYAAEAGGPP